MNLREKMLSKSKVASLPCIDMQLCNSPLNNATTHATLVQQPAANTHAIGLTYATVDATPVQLSSCADVKKTTLKVALNSRTVVSAPTIDDKLLGQLLAAAMRACDFWGDSQAARIEMIADIKATPHHLRQDLLEHFLSAYGKAK
jgi:hypothetical protein